MRASRDEFIEQSVQMAALAGWSSDLVEGYEAYLEKKVPHRKAEPETIREKPDDERGKPLFKAVEKVQKANEGKG